MFDSKKVLNKTINHKASENAFSVLNAELKRMHQLYNHANDRCNLTNMQIFYAQIEDLQKCLKDAIKKGMNEDVKKEIKDIQSTIADILLTGSGNENNNI